MGRAWDNDPKDWARTVAVNLMEMFYGCRAVIPAMLARGYGRIVNMSGEGGPKMSAYDAAKTGIVNLTEILVLELADTSITVNAISQPAPSTPGCGRKRGTWRWLSATRPLTSGACR